MNTPLVSLDRYLRQVRIDLKQRGYTGVVRVMTTPGKTEHHAWVAGHITGRYRFGWRAQRRIRWVLRNQELAVTRSCARVVDPAKADELQAAIAEWLGLGRAAS